MNLVVEALKKSNTSKEDVKQLIFKSAEKAMLYSLFMWFAKVNGSSAQELSHKTTNVISETKEFNEALASGEISDANLELFYQAMSEVNEYYTQIFK